MEQINAKGDPLKTAVITSTFVFVGAFLGGAAGELIQSRSVTSIPFSSSSAITVVQDSVAKSYVTTVQNYESESDARLEKCLRIVACKERYLKSLKDAGSFYLQASETYTPIIEIL